MNFATGDTISFFHPDENFSIIKTGGIITEIDTNAINETIWAVRLQKPSEIKKDYVQLRPRLKTIWPRKVILTERI